VKKIVLGLVVVLLIAAAAVAGYIYNVVTTLAHESVTDDLHMISLPRGPGGNVAVLRTDEGTVIVDTMTFGAQGSAVRELAEELTGQPVVLVINTHYHIDHTHGNPSFDPATKIVATERTRELLLEHDGEFWQGNAEQFLPDETFEHEHTIELGGKTIQLLGVGPAHTSGDLVALFVEDRTICTGDLIFNGLYPNIDLEAGGSVKRWSAALDQVLQLDFDRAIPGHGPVTDRNGVRRFQGFITELARAGEFAAVRRLSLEETLAQTKLTKNEGMVDFLPVPGMYEFTRDFVVQRAWEEAVAVRKAEAEAERRSAEEADEAEKSAEAGTATNDTEPTEQ